MSDGTLIAEVWMTLANYIKESEREHATKQMIHVLDAYGFTKEDYEDMLMDHDDPELRNAIDLYANPIQDDDIEWDEE